MKIRHFIAIASIVASLAANAADAADDYQLTHLGNTTSGMSSSSADYSLDSSSAPASNGSSAAYSSRSDFVTQLPSITGIALSTPTLIFNEGSSLQISAESLFDDGSRYLLNPEELAWFIVSGPIAGINVEGLATASPVYQNEQAILRADLGNFTETLSLTVADAFPDNYSSYAGDDLPDTWQVQNFGLNAAKAGKHEDFDGDLVSNLFEYASGTNPTSVGIGHAPLSYQGNLIVPGLPLVEFMPASGVLPHRAVFIRRKQSMNLSYTPQFSINLTTWSTATTPLEVLADNGEYQVVSHRFPMTIDGLESHSKFFRLFVHPTPTP